MAKRLFSILAALSFFSSVCFAYALTETREEMLTYYQEKIEPKVPKSARMLVGNEKINVYVGGKVLGIETRRGELYSFETAPLNNPTIIVTVTDEAFGSIEQKKTGILPLIESGGIRIEAKTFFSAIKIETIKRIYAVSGMDDVIMGRKKGYSAMENYNSIYVQKVRIAG